jgi:hypothetical protein
VFAAPTAASRSDSPLGSATAYCTCAAASSLMFCDSLNMYCDCCPPGTYNDGSTYKSDKNFCYDCAGCSQVSGSESCLKCRPGSYAPATAARSCTPCPAGTYQSDEGSTACLPCSPGTFCTGTGSSVQSLCPTGSYNSNSQSSACTLCPAGSYQSMIGYSGGSCTKCPAGTYQPSSGSASCIQCDAGAFCPSVGSAVKTLCPSGTYNPNSGATSCVTCPHTTESNVIGATLLTNCTNGTLSSRIDSLSFEIASSDRIAGKFSVSLTVSFTRTAFVQPGTVLTVTYPPGFFSPSITPKVYPSSSSVSGLTLTCGSTTATSFLVTTSGAPVLGGSPCTITFTGLVLGPSTAGAREMSVRIESDLPLYVHSGTISADSCASLTTWTTCSLSRNIASGSLCSWCSNNSVCVDSTSRYPCSSGLYTSPCTCCDVLPGRCMTDCTHTMCSVWDRNWCQCNIDKTNCGNPWYSCGNCPVGAFCPQSDTFPFIPKQCPAGSFSLGNAVTCTLCPVGTYQSEPGKSSCLDCPTGNFCPSQGMNFPTLCSPGYFQNVISATECLPCPAGRFCLAGCNVSSGSGLCPAGSFSTSGSGTNSSCNTCPQGFRSSHDLSSCILSQVTSVTFKIASSDRVAGKVFVPVTLAFTLATPLDVGGTITLTYPSGFFQRFVTPTVAAGSSSVARLTGVCGATTASSVVIVTSGANINEGSPFTVTLMGLTMGAATASSVSVSVRVSCEILPSVAVESGIVSSSDLGEVPSLFFPITHVEESPQHLCVIDVSGGLKCWGQNLYGQLGIGSTTITDTPTNVEGLGSGVLMVSVFGHTCAVVDTGGLKCWGWNNRGQLGIGSTQDQSVPADVTALGDKVLIVAAGGQHTCAVMEDRVLKCWGSNYWGQLGIGSTLDAYAPSNPSFSQ